MSRLTVYDEDEPGRQRLRTEDADEIAAALAPLQVRFERWASPVRIAPDAPAETILEAYRPYLDRLMGATGAGSADVIRMTPDHPRAAALRDTFLHEHHHTEPEIRFFVDGAGHFVLHADGRVYDVLCERDDLIFVPAGIHHWFDAGERPRFTALRVFTSSEGWVAHYTGRTISERFPAA